MMRPYIFFLLFTVFTTLFSCVKQPSPLQSGMGKRPLYISLEELKDIRNLDPQPIEETGTIVLLDSLFFMAEYKKGIHVFLLDSTATESVLTFIQVPAITDFTVANGRIYADSWKDLVTIDVSDIYHVKEVGRSADAFQPVLFPPLYQGIFECVDESRGAVIGWEDAELKDAACEVL